MKIQNSIHIVKLKQFALTEVTPQKLEKFKSDIVSAFAPDKVVFDEHGIVENVLTFVDTIDADGSENKTDNVNQEKDKITEKSVPTVTPEELAKENQKNIEKAFGFNSQKDDVDALALAMIAGAFPLYYRYSPKHPFELDDDSSATHGKAHRGTSGNRKTTTPNNSNNAKSSLDAEEWLELIKALK
jgi:hypothetical protein